MMGSHAPDSQRKSWATWIRGGNESALTEDGSSDVTQSRTQKRHRQGHRMSQSTSWVGPY